MLHNAVELRQAHWLWLPDLSQPDPTHVLPILIIITMFLTQYITPSPGMDPAQRRMMAFMMPVFFGFMLWHYASGLALYWGTSNIIYLAMQIGINQSALGKEMHAIAARRANKTVVAAKPSDSCDASTEACAWRNGQYAGYYLSRFAASLLRAIVQAYG